MIRGLLMLLAIATLGLSGLGCGDEFRCKTDFDCPATQVCNANGSCETFVCEVDDDCADPKTTCVSNACVAR